MTALVVVLAATTVLFLVSWICAERACRRADTRYRRAEERYQRADLRYRRAIGEDVDDEL